MTNLTEHGGDIFPCDGEDPVDIRIQTPISRSAADLPKSKFDSLTATLKTIPITFGTGPTAFAKVISTHFPPR